MNKFLNPGKTLLFILFISLLVSTNAFSQGKYKRKISITEWIEEMKNCTDRQYYLEDTEIYYDEDIDSLYAYYQPRTKPTARDSEREIEIAASVLLDNCELPDNSTCQIRNIVFQKNVRFSLCEGAVQLIIYNCTFQQGLDIHNSELKSLEFLYCSLFQRTLVIESQISLLSYGDCSFHTDYRVVNNDANYGFEEENHKSQFLFRIHLIDKKINAFRMSDCKLLPSDVKPVISFVGGKYDIIEFSGLDFNNAILDFLYCSVKENFTVENCTLNEPVGMYKFNFPANNTSFLWGQLDSVGIGMYRDYGQPPYTSKRDTVISEVNLYNELNSSYRKLFSMYRTQGDMESANACYIQMKDMETEKYRYLYQQNPGIQKWFNWRFNQFLKAFSEYGTNPVQSLIASMWTILLFAAVYFFFYSEWDGINRSFLIKQHRQIMHYFRSEQRLEDFYTDNYKEDFKTFADYKKEMRESRAELPAFIVFLGKPLYLLSVVRHKFLTSVYHRTEVLHGRWIDLKPVRKIFVGIIVGFSITLYLFYLVLIRAINSTTLSINTFSTLGFGAIPVKGISRYITIIEGFLGWFLLSIFSVSLISQMLQS